MPTWYNLKEVKDQEGNSTAILDLFDEIGGWGIQAGEVIAKLRALGDNGDLVVNINSPGGSIIAGNAIFNALLLSKRNKIANIDFAASMASVIAMACDNICMAENGWMMIHKPWTVTMGSADELRKDADVLDKMQKNIVHAYQRQTDLSEAEVNGLMDAETWMDAKDALRLGFIDRISATSEQAAASLTRHADLIAQFKVHPKAKAPEAAAVPPAPPATTTETVAGGVAEAQGSATAPPPAPDPAADLKARTDAAYAEGFDAGKAAGQKESAGALQKAKDDFTAATENIKALNAKCDAQDARLQGLDAAHEAEIKAMGTKLADEHRAAMAAAKVEADKALDAAVKPRDDELKMLRSTVATLSPGFLAPKQADPPADWEQAVRGLMVAGKLTWEEAREKAENDFPDLFKQFHHPRNETK